MFSTEVDFTLPCGYLDADGAVHREGRMRLATAADEILPARDPRVMKNPAYLVIIVLSRVVSRLGTVAVINPGTIESMYAKDVAFLQDLYNRVNGFRPMLERVHCPACNAAFDWEVPPPGGSTATP